MMTPPPAAPALTPWTDKQLYVAISRVSDEDREFIRVRQDMLGEHGHAYTKNVVWLELLLNRRIAMQEFVPG
jgi:hypothetical protein